MASSHDESFDSLRIPDAITYYRFSSCSIGSSICSRIAYRTHVTTSDMNTQT